MVRHVIQLVNLAVMRIKDLLESCRQILEEMKAVGDLRGFWSSLPNASGLGFGAGDNREVGMGVQPGGHAPRATLDDTLLLRTRRLRGIEIDEVRRTVAVGAGIKFGELCDALDGTGLNRKFITGAKGPGALVVVQS